MPDILVISEQIRVENFTRSVAMRVNPFRENKQTVLWTGKVITSCRKKNIVVDAGLQIEFEPEG